MDQNVLPELRANREIEPCGGHKGTNDGQVRETILGQIDLKSTGG
jgi:hypothetical protein